MVKGLVENCAATCLYRCLIHKVLVSWCKYISVLMLPVVVLYAPLRDAQAAGRSTDSSSTDNLSFPSSQVQSSFSRKQVLNPEIMALAGIMRWH